MKIAIPEGLQIEAEAGGTTELLAKFSVTEDGQLELTALDGIPVEVVEEEVEEELSAEDEAELEQLMSAIGTESMEEQPQGPPSEEEYFESKR